MKSAHPLHLAEVLAALSLATDLANDQPFETSLRACLLATELARAAGASTEAIADVYYAGLLRFVGCTAFSSEWAGALGGDDNVLHKTFAPIDARRPGELLPAAIGLGKGRGLKQRVRAVTNFVTGGPAILTAFAASNCEAALRFAMRLDMSAGVVATLGQIYTRWDGRGFPQTLAEESIALPARILQVARVAEIHTRVTGLAHARSVLKTRAGGQLDPHLVKVFTQEAEALLAPLEGPSVWDAVLARAPSTNPSRAGIAEVARAFADFTDLKSVYSAGHSTSVADLAERAAKHLGLDEPARANVRHAALLHDLGSVSVPAGIWEKKGTLTTAEWERVRLHPYYTERVLSRSPLLSEVATLAGAHHERCDGSGYSRGTPAAMIPPDAMVIAAADCYCAFLEARPHRPALGAAEAVRALRAEVTHRRLEAEIVEAILEAAGHERQRRRQTWPRGLSDREVDVLRRVARGCSNKDIAEQLSISPRTVQHHVAHIYEKIGVSTRAGATLFASEHDLLGVLAG
ncbi:LuxR C-terminal-related transcriptional regulator [Pendulispora rubella]|uniref:LuxR C-terminal-related transcriptional regulator n=1 Tax=Pendulispora rubella TaxID=2741070 RepID=A0ABZ2LIZ3_9BACT